MKKNIIVLGGGYAGLEAAKALHKHLRNDSAIAITMIDTNEYHTLLTELHEIAGNRVENSGVKVSIHHVLEYTKVNFIQDRIIKADLAEKKLYSANQEYSFDYLVLAVGSEPAYFGIDGMQQHGFCLWTFDDAVRIRKHIISMFEMASKEKNPDIRKELLTFVIGGGGFTGIEMVGELIQWTRYMAHDYEIKKNEVQLVVVEALPKILPVLKDKLIQKAERFLIKNSVQIKTMSPITQVTPDKVIISSGEEILTRTLIWTGGIQTKEFVRNLGITLGKRNRIVVNEYLQTKEFSYVYAVGDDMEHTDKEGKVLPPLVETALQSAKAAANNIVALLRGKNQQPLQAKLHGVMISIGSVYAVADVMGMSMSSLFATAMKHLVNIHYLFSLGGLELIMAYINHQFLHKVRKGNWVLDQGLNHVKVKTFTFWLTIIRIWLGITWVAEGINKINQGWFQYVKLGPADATSSASITSLISSHTPSWYGWIVETIIYPNSLIFQKMIVVTEIGLGLAFITGTLTVIAALVAIALNVNFMLSTGLPIVQSTKLPDLWYLIASASMLGGGGRAFGLDHYIMPFLRNKVRWFQRNVGKS